MTKTQMVAQNKTSISKKICFSLVFLMLLLTYFLIGTLAAEPDYVSFNYNEIMVGGTYYHQDLATAAALCNQLTNGEYPIPSDWGLGNSFDSPWGCIGKPMQGWNKVSQSWVTKNHCREDGVTQGHIRELTCRKQLPNEPNPANILPSTETIHLNSPLIHNYYLTNDPKALFKATGAQNDVLSHIPTMNKICEDVTGGDYPLAYWFKGQAYWGCSDENLYILNDAGTAWIDVGNVCTGSGPGLEFTHGIDSEGVYCAKYQEPACSNNSDCDDSDDYTEDSCINPGTPDAFCQYTDITCLLDSDCGNNELCIDQVCVGYMCSDNSDCDDLNDYTEDTCINPGTLDSQCNYEDIDCLQNSDCGTNSFLNDLFCNDNDVFDFFITYTCEYAGTTDSVCVGVVEEREFEDCGEDYCEDWQPTYCSGGDVFHERACYAYECVENPDAQCNTAEADILERTATCEYGCSDGACENAMQCEDGTDNDDDNLIDEEDPGCWDNPNDPNTYNEDLNDESASTSSCSSDNDCGNNGYLGDRYCIDNGVNQDFQEFTCLNPGIESAQCLNTIEPRLIRDCDDDDECEDGRCNEGPGDDDDDDGKDDDNIIIYASGDDIGSDGLDLFKDINPIDATSYKINLQNAQTKTTSYFWIIILAILIAIVLLLILIRLLTF